MPADGVAMAKGYTECAGTATSSNLPTGSRLGCPRQSWKSPPARKPRSTLSDQSLEPYLRALWTVAKRLKLALTSCKRRRTIVSAANATQSSYRDCSPRVVAEEADAAAIAMILRRCEGAGVMSRDRAQQPIAPQLLCWHSNCGFRSELGGQVTSWTKSSQQKHLWRAKPQQSPWRYRDAPGPGAEPGIPC
jgi:hypothetical protein